MLVLVLYGSLKRGIDYSVVVFGGGCLGRCCLILCYQGLLFCRFYGWCCWPEAKLLWVFVRLLLYNVESCGVCVL